MEHGVAMGKRPALTILPREPDRRAVSEQRRERERLGMPPVDSAGFTHRVPTPLELLREARVGREPGWPREQLFVQRDELLWTHGRFGTDHRPGRTTAVLVVIVCLR